MKQKMFSLFLAIVMMLGMVVPSYYADSKYAYSIGVHHSRRDEDSGDFTPNVNYAAKVYALISNISGSYKNYNPTIDYMRGNSANGSRRIASKIVFLNGHGNNSLIAFSQNSKGDDYKTGVHYDEDFTSSSTGIGYVGINSTDMSGVDLISFVGCSTAEGRDNLASRAVDQGATTAVGFTESIHSRNSSGPDWLRKYNDCLANGHSVRKAINYATSLYPSSDLGDYAIIYGSEYNSVRSTSSKELEENVPMQELVSYDMDITMNSQNTDIMRSLSNSEIAVPQKLIQKIIEIDKNFNANNYKVSVNIYNDNNDGLMKLTYYIDGKIKTNKVYIAIIENGVITGINDTIKSHNLVNPYRNDNDLMSEQEIIEKVNRFNEQEYLSNKSIQNTERMSLDKIKEESGEFVYDYNTNELKYIHSKFVISEKLDGAIVDQSEEIIIY